MVCKLELQSWTSETEVDYYHQKMNLRIASRAANLLKIQDFRKLEKSKKSLKCLDLMANNQPATEITNIVAKQKRKKTAKSHLQNIPKKKLFYLIL